MNTATAYMPGTGRTNPVPFFGETSLPCAPVRTYAPKQEIFFEGDVKRSVYKIEGGAVCLYKTMADGRRQIFDFAFIGDTLGLGAAGAYSCSAQAIGEVRVRCVPISRLYELAAQDPNIALELYRAVSSELEATRDLLLALGRFGSLERVAIFLLALSQRNVHSKKNSLILTLPMTRTDIADLLGMTIETVSRSLTKLRNSKLIEVIRGSTIQIMDVEGLRALGHRIYH